MSYEEKKSKIDQLKKEIESFGQLSDNVKKKINYKFRLDWNYYSNKMEGNTLTLRETRHVMVGNISIHEKPLKDLLEMKGHDEVISEILNIGEGRVRLSEKRIREIHRGIMHEDSQEERKKIGEWKEHPNHIINYKNEKFHFAEPSDVPDLIHDLLNKTNAETDRILKNKKDSLHPIDVAFNFHLSFLNIHPFYDGNGRTARILTNLLLISFGYPPFWITEKEREIYYKYLADIQGYGGKEDLLFDFMADLIIRSQNLILDAIHGKEISEEADLEKEIALLKAQLEEKDELSVKATPREIHKVMENNIFPLLEKLEIKAEDLTDLFMEKSRKINYQCHGEAIFQVGTGKSIWKNIKENWFKNNIKAGKKKLRFFHYSFGLIGFKKTVEASSIKVDIKINFNEFNYNIDFGSNEIQSLQFPYGQKWDNEEISSIVVPVIRELIKQIKAINTKTK